MPIQILDIYQGNPFNAVQEKATGTNAVLIKAGQGGTQDYLEHKCGYIEQCDHAGLPWGVYWQMDARYSPERHKAALKAFRDVIGFGQLGLWLACEKPFYPCPDWLYARMPYAFYKPVESIWRGLFEYTGVYPGIYTSPAMFKLIFGQCPLLLQYEFAEKARLWVAQYQVEKPDKIGPWSKYCFWQYQGEPDYSVFGGTDDEFYKFAGIAHDAPEPEPVPADPRYIKLLRDCHPYIIQIETASSNIEALMSDYTEGK